MVDKSVRRDHPQADERHEYRSNGGVVFLLVALALVLAIGFFYLTNDRHSDRAADKLTQAAANADDRAIAVGDAARKAVSGLHANKPEKSGK